jgi:O-6-methylguanine DNA methyltransferase
MPGARLSLHQDKDERDFEAPIVSVSLGMTATFLFGGFERAERTVKIPLYHGDSINVATAGTDLQRDVWAALRRIPVGQTTTYGALGRLLRFTDPRAAIDVGTAIGANPIAVIVPCHRVVASNGELKGYPWGLHRKRWLSEHAKAIQLQVGAPQSASLPGF